MERSEYTSKNGSAFRKALFERWSSHPTSLEKQKTVWLWLGLSPLAVLAVFAAFALSGMEGVLSLFRHPGIWLKVAGAALSMSLGATLTFSVLSLMARGAFKRKADLHGADNLSVSVPLVGLMAFFWVVPAVLSFLDHLWGGRLVPGPLMFMLNLLCFAPFVILVLWVRFATCDTGKPEMRRPIWFILGTVFLSLMVLSLLDSVPSVAMQSAFARFLGRMGLDLEPALRKVALFATLLPLSLVCYSMWLLFRGKAGGRASGGKGADGKKGNRKGLFSRLWDWLFGGKDDEPEEPEQPSGEKAPPWVYEFIKKIPQGIALETHEPGEPDPLDSVETSDFDETPAGDDLAFLMTGEVIVPESGTEEKECQADGAPENPGKESNRERHFRPTEAQSAFFRRFREAYDEALEKATAGTIVSADMVLAGDEGTGRSELLRACAIFAAFARGQHVLYLVPDQRQAETVRDKLRGCIDRMMLSCYLTCDILDAEKVIGWMKGVSMGDSGFEGQPIPTILLATPRMVEGCLFDNDRASDENSLNQLRHVIQTFEVVLIDDFMELDATERAHTTFVVHKFQTLLAYKRVLPQIVVVMPRLLDGVGVSEVGDKLFGKTDFDLNNYLVLKPRPLPGGHGAWKLPLRVTETGASPSDACEVLVRKCLELGLDVVMFRKGITIHQCEKAQEELAHGIETGTLKVISRLDQLASPAEPDAVFYLAALSGDAGVSLRLNFGGEQSVFIRIAGADDMDFDVTDIVPVLPDRSAVALRVHHLKSLLRFITPNEPLPESFWQHFGLSVQGKGLATVKRGDSFTPSVEWGVDYWEESAAYGEPLDSQIFLAGEALASNAGVRIPFASLPLLQENIYRLKGEDRLILGVAGESPEDGRTEQEGEDVVPCALAKWVEDGRPLTGCDLSHVERLVLARSDDGDYAGKPGQNVLTVSRFEKGEAGCCAWIETQHWIGDGTDHDMPVRTLSWELEPVVQPQIHIYADDCTFLGFDLPESRGIPRYVTASIPWRMNQNGHLQQVSPPVRYRYPAYGSALVLLPRRMDPAQAPAQVQRFVDGSWTTGDPDSFSPALTHLFTGVLRRIVPDLPFFAACPAFASAEIEGSIGEMVVWILEPTNSGKSMNAILERFFGMGGGPAVNPFLARERDKKNPGVTAGGLVAAMREALHRANSFGDAEAKLRWLRLFSGVAYDTPMETDEDRRRFGEDLERCERVLGELENRLRGGYSPTEGDEAPSLSETPSWIVQAKEIDSSRVDGTVEWENTSTLPEGFGIGTGAKHCKWTVWRKDLGVDYGFADAAGHAAFEGVLNETWLDRWGTRISTPSCSEYGENDPYRKVLDALYVRLEREFVQFGKKRGQPAYEREFAEFLLAFVQGGMDYVEDPKLPESDWPRFPTETLSLQHGDCEDTTILYMELLRRAKIDCAYLGIPEHAAVGVCVDVPKTKSGKAPVCYSWLGKRYIYAETAMKAGTYLALGEESSLIPSAKSIPAKVIPTPPPMPAENNSIRILNAAWDGDSSFRIAVCGTQEPSAGEKPLCVACFARPRKDVFGAPEPGKYPMVGAADIPAPKTGEILEGRVSIRSPGFLPYWLDVFVCEKETGSVRGHFVAVAHFVSKKRGAEKREERSGQ